VEKVELIGAETKEDKEFVYEELKEFLQYLPEEDSYDELILESERKIGKCDEQIKKIDRKLGLVGNADFTAIGMLMAAVYNFANFVIQLDIHEYFKEVISANLAFLAAFIVKEVYDHNTKDSRTNKLYIDKEKVEEKRNEELRKLNKLRLSKNYSESLEELKRSL